MTKPFEDVVMQIWECATTLDGIDQHIGEDILDKHMLHILQLDLKQELLKLINLIDTNRDELIVEINKLGLDS